MTANESPTSQSADHPNAECQHRSSRLSVALFYISHLLFTWNDRVWEFASIIFLISAYPLTLLPSSVLGLATTGFAIAFGPTVGRWFDSSPRLSSVRFAIACQRLSVSIGCICLWVMLCGFGGRRVKDVLFAVVIILACLARGAFVGKTAGIERDWVPMSSKWTNSRPLL
jgi:solute carrier family 40 (iron-regulated transporter), member 1